MFHKFKKIFTPWHNIDPKKWEKNLADIIKHSEGLTASQKYQAKKKILAGIEKVQKTTGKDAVREKDFKKILPHLWGPKIISKSEAENIYNLAKFGRLPKQEKEIEQKTAVKEEPELKKVQKEPRDNAWIESIRAKYAKQNEEYGKSMLRSSENDNRLGGTPHNPYAKDDSEFGGVKSNGRETPNAAPNHETHGRGAPHGAPSRDLSHEGGNLTPHTESPGSSNEFNK